jgi:hypothetical protein
LEPSWTSWASGPLEISMRKKSWRCGKSTGRWWKSWEVAARVNLYTLKEVEKPPNYGTSWIPHHGFCTVC